jgi:hypothetical protein
MNKVKRIPVSNCFLSRILKQTEFKEKIQRGFPRDYVLDVWLPYFQTDNSKGCLVFCKDVDWHIDSDDLNSEFKYSSLWVLKTKNSKLEVKNHDDKVKEFNLRKGDLIRFKNCDKHRLLTTENKVSVFLVLDSVNHFLSARYLKVKLENFITYTLGGNDD